MAMASGVYGASIRDILDPSQVNMDVLNSGMKMILVTDTHTPNFNTHTSYSDVTNEIANGNGYTTGGQGMTSLTLVASTGVLTFDAADTPWTSSTFSAVRGRIIYDDTPTTPTANPLFLATTFGADYSVTSGTLTVQENASGILTLAYT